MSVNVRGDQRGAKGKFLVDVYIKFSNGEVRRKKFVVGAGTAYSAETRTEREARRWGEARERELFAEGPPSQQKAQEPERRRSAVPSATAFAPDWLAMQRAVGTKASSIDAQESILRIHVLPFAGDLPLDQLDGKVRVRLLETWRKGGYEYVDQFGRHRTVRPTDSHKTLNNRQSVVRAMLKYACEPDIGVLTAMPCNFDMLVVDDGAEMAFYDHPTYEQLVLGAERTKDPRILAVVLLAGDFGLRRGEIIALQQCHVDFVAGRIQVKDNVYVKKGEQLVDRTKGGKSAKGQKASKRLIAALKACRHMRGERMLMTDDSKPITPKIVRIWIERAERAAGLPVTGRIHILRHTYASHLAMAGVPARTIQARCRHSSLEITMRYMHLSPQSDDDAVEMLEESRALGGVAVSRRVKAG